MTPPLDILSIHVEDFADAIRSPVQCSDRKALAYLPRTQGLVRVAFQSHALLFDAVESVSETCRWVYSSVTRQSAYIA